jgi:hypothetical protein
VSLAGEKEGEKSDIEKDLEDPTQSLRHDGTFHYCVSCKYRVPVKGTPVPFASGISFARIVGWHHSHLFHYFFQFMI